MGASGNQKFCRKVNSILLLQTNLGNHIADVQNFLCNLFCYCFIFTLDHHNYVLQALALCFSAAEYCAPVWSHSKHTKLLDSSLNECMRFVTGCIRACQWTYCQY